MINLFHIKVTKDKAKTRVTVCRGWGGPAPLVQSSSPGAASSFLKYVKTSTTSVQK